MKTTMLTNSFHGTQVRIDSRWTERAEREQVRVTDLLYHQGFNLGDESAKRAYRRVEKTLCGIDGCTCGIVR